jgi:hypothetical protein
MAYKKEQWLMIIAASLFLAGAVFMLVNTFGGLEWALWTGLGFAAAAMCVYVLIVFINFRFNKKYTMSEREYQEAEQKAASSPAPQATAGSDAPKSMVKAETNSTEIKEVKEEPNPEAKETKAKPKAKTAKPKSKKTKK